jgi:hypothetical protein
MNNLRGRLVIAAAVFLALLGPAANPASAAGSGRCALLSVRETRGDPWPLHGRWVAKVLVENTFSMVEHIRGVWRVEPPYEGRFELRARLQPGEREVAKYPLEKGDARPSVNLRGCHIKAPTLGH